MTKGELVEALSDWADDTVLEVSVSLEADMESSHNDETKIWYEIENVEKFVEEAGHCLIIAGKVTMC